MNAHPDHPDEPIEPACAAALEVLQRRLDGEPTVTPPAVAAHIADCPDCSGRFAAIDRLLHGLNRDILPLSRLSTECIVADAIADLRRRRRIRRWSYAAAGFGCGCDDGIVGDSSAGADASRSRSRSKVGSANLRQDLADAGAAVASLTRRTAVDAVDAGRQLVPTVPAPWPMALEPTRSFDEAGAGLAEGLEPVTSSAHRAAQMFLRRSRRRPKRSIDLGDAKVI